MLLILKLLRIKMDRVVSLEIVTGDHILGVFSDKSLQSCARHMLEFTHVSMCEHENGVYLYMYARL